MAEEVNVGDQIDLGKVGYVRLPDGAVVTSGRFYTVRHEGLHVAFGNDEVEYEAVDSTKTVEAGEVAEDNEPEAPKVKVTPPKPSGPPAPPSA